MLETSFGLNFFLKTPRNESPDGTRHIYMRVTVNRQIKTLPQNEYGIRLNGMSVQEGQLVTRKTLKSLTVTWIR
jgi:hypothetical protein